jgi:AraC family transcriptional regulator
VKKIYNYEQIMLSEAILMNNLKSPPKIEEIAKTMNLTPSSLVRGFKRMFGKTLYKYHLENKMEFAKKLILEKGITVKKVAEMMGYKQTSAFIQSFTKQFNCSPGNLKV